MFGDDTPDGRDDADTFVFKSGGGSDLVTDWTRGEGDTIALDFSDIDTFADVPALLTDVGPDTEISFADRLVPTADAAHAESLLFTPYAKLVLCVARKSGKTPKSSVAEIPARPHTHKDPGLVQHVAAARTTQVEADPLVDRGLEWSYE